MHALLDGSVEMAVHTGTPSARVQERLVNVEMGVEQQTVCKEPLTGGNDELGRCLSDSQFAHQTRSRSLPV